MDPPPVQPPVQVLKRPGVQSVDASLRLGPDLDQARLPQYPQVPGDCGPADRKRRGQLAGIPLPLSQHLDDLQPDRVGQRGQNLHCEYVTLDLRNCQVTYDPDAWRIQ